MRLSLSKLEREQRSGVSVNIFCMFSSLLIRLLHLPIRVFASCIQRVYINHISFEQADDGRSLVRKRRSWFAGLLIFPGNVVFWFRRVPLRVLYNGQWLRWERTLKLALRNESIPAGTELLCETIPGQPLSQCLCDRQVESVGRLKLLTVATVALKNLHKETVLLPGFERPIILSHGDAAISNVLYCDQTEQAEWFDFDLRHDFRMDADQRHADDLRSLIFSAGVFCPAEELESIVSMVKHEYRCDRVWAALQSQLVSRWFWFDLFHLSQIRRMQAISLAGGDELSAKDISLVRLIVQAQ